MAPRLTSRTIELRRVVITGMGAVSPLGNDVATLLDALMKGVSGIAPLERFAVDDLPVNFGGPVKGFDPDDGAREEGGAAPRRAPRIRDGGGGRGRETTRGWRCRLDARRARRRAVGRGFAGLETMPRPASRW